jgi:hypothetical protein
MFVGGITLVQWMIDAQVSQVEKLAKFIRRHGVAHLLVSRLSSSSSLKFISMKSLAIGILALAGAVSAQAGAYDQCGGITYSGSTSCVGGYFCTSYNPYYYQCIPGKEIPS